MNHLIVDTSTRQNWIALFKDDRMCSCLHFEDKQSCLTNLIPGIKQLLDNAQLEIKHVNRCSTVIGPGAWSSLRIGLATVKQLCLANQIALSTLTSSEVIAGYTQLIGITSPTLLTVQDASGGKIYSAVYEWKEDHYELVVSDAWQSASDAANQVADVSNLTIVGDGANLLGSHLQTGWHLVHASPQADSRYLRYLAQSAVATTAEGYNHQHVLSLKPLYIQPSSAEIEFKVQVT